MAGVVGVSAVTMRSYKSYFLLVLVPYLFLIFMFHTQLQLYDSNSLRTLTADQIMLGRSDFAAQSYHVRSLRIKNASGSEDLYNSHVGGHRGKGRSFGHQRINASHDVVVQGDRTMYYKTGTLQRDDGESRVKVVVKETDHVAGYHGNTHNNNGGENSNFVQQVPVANQDQAPVVMEKAKRPSYRKLSRHGLPYIGMNTSELLHTLMAQAGVQSDKGNLYTDAQWPHCRQQGQEESIEYRLQQNDQQQDQRPGQQGAEGMLPSLPTFHSLPKVEALKFQSIYGNYFYSAFYDDREPEAAYIRLIALLKKGARPALFCHFLSSRVPGHLDPLRPDKVFTSMLTYYEMCENHAKDYGGWILTCEVPSSLEPSPCEVTVSLHSTYNPQQPGNVRIPIMLLRNPSAKRSDFGICVPPLFGYIPSTTLIEFVELTKILGANHFMFYAHQIPREIQKVLRYYERIGVATVIPWDLPVTDKGIWYHGQLLAINDCLYRSMHRYKYVAFNDIDEFIVPHRHGNWSDMMRYIETVLNKDGVEYSGYSYQSAFFDPLLESSSRVLYDLESDLRTKSFSKVRTKVMVDSERIHELGIHHISKPVLDTQKTLYIEPEVAFLHHYRKCVTDFDPRMNCQVFARDESLSRYIPTLRHNVHQTMWILKEAEKQGHSMDYLIGNGRT